MTKLTSSSSLFINTIGEGGSGGGGGGGSNLIVIDNLDSTSSSAVLSARQGNVLKLKIDDLETNYSIISNTVLDLNTVVNNIDSSVNDLSSQLSDLKDAFDNIEIDIKNATETEYGLVKIDGDTIKINEDGQIYVDMGSGELTKTEFVLRPTSIGQTDLEFTLVGYTPEEYVDLLYYNTTKVHAVDYTISPVNAETFTYKLVLSKPVTSLNAIYNLVLLHNDSNSPNAKLTKFEYVMNVSPIDSSIIELPTSIYNPDTFIDLLFNNTVKVHSTDYQILPKDNTDISKGYYIKLNNPPTKPTTTFYNLVLITNGLSSGGGIIDASRFYEGTNAPLNESLIWYKTS